MPRREGVPNLLRIYIVDLVFECCSAFLRPRGLPFLCSVSSEYMLHIFTLWSSPRWLCCHLKAPLLFQQAASSPQASSAVFYWRKGARERSRGTRSVTGSGTGIGAATGTGTRLSTVGSLSGWWTPADDVFRVWHLKETFLGSILFSLGTRNSRLASTCILCSFNLAARFLTHLRPKQQQQQQGEGQHQQLQLQLQLQSHHRLCWSLPGCATDFLTAQSAHLAEAAKGRDNGRAERRLATCLTQNKRTSRSPPRPTTMLFALPRLHCLSYLAPLPVASFVCPFSTLVQFRRFVLSILMFSFLLLFITQFFFILFFFFSFAWSSVRQSDRQFVCVLSVFLARRQAERLEPCRLWLPARVCFSKPVQKRKVR